MRIEMAKGQKEAAAVSGKFHETLQKLADLQVKADAERQEYMKRQEAMYERMEAANREHAKEMVELNARVIDAISNIDSGPSCSIV
jgi:hypothetical protein